MASLHSVAARRCIANMISSVGRVQPSAIFTQKRGFASERNVTYKQTPYEKNEIVGDKKYSQFDIGGKVFVVTGGGQGLGFAMAQGLMEAGGTVHVLDTSQKPTKVFEEAKARAKDDFNGYLEYHQVDVTNPVLLGETVSDIAARKSRLDGLIAAAAIQQVTKVIDYQKADMARMMDVNVTGVFLAAQACAREMLKHKTEGSMCLVASMSGSIANRDLNAPVYNLSKAAVVQMARSMAMEFGRKRPDGSGGIRVNSLSPGHIVTPMVEENFRRGEADRAQWEDHNMLGRISTPEEFKSVALFMLSKASSYMTGHDLKIDAGTTAW